MILCIIIFEGQRTVDWSERMQREITEKHKVFEPDGRVMCAGWARSPVFEYNAAQSASAGRHGERDCYFINNGEVSLYLSVENAGMEFAVKIAVADLKRGGVLSDCVVKRFVFSKNELPEPDNEGELLYTDRRIQLKLENTPDGRYLRCDFIDFGGHKNLYFNILLKKTDGESLNELAPFERNRKYFYLKRFAPAFTAAGVIRVGGIEYSLNELNSIAYLDLTRCSKPRKHNYQRLGCDCFIGGKRFSLCLASRVGDNRYGNENCFFVDSRLQKLSQINVKSSGKLYRPCYFKAGISAVDIMFKPFTVKGEPMAAHMDKTDVVFGRLYGEIKRVDMEPVVLDNAQAHMVLSEL